MSDLTSVTITREDRSLQFLDDYCPRCNPLGRHQADRRVRETSLTEPDALTWNGGAYVTCEYRCEGCGHQWRRDDLWTAANAGLEPVKGRRAA